MKTILKDLSAVNEILIEEMEVMPDHIHLLISFKPKHAPSSIVKYLKGHSAKIFFQNHPEIRDSSFWGGHLWSHSYYMSTLGNMSQEVVEKYIRNQYTKWPRTHSSPDFVRRFLLLINWKKDTPMSWGILFSGLFLFLIMLFYGLAAFVYCSYFSVFVPFVNDLRQRISFHHINHGSQFFDFTHRTDFLILLNLYQSNYRSIKSDTVRLIIKAFRFFLSSGFSQYFNRFFWFIDFLR